MLDVWLTVPTRGGRDSYLNQLIEDSGIPRSKVVVVHTDMRTVSDIEGCLNIPCTKLNIQHWWNIGIQIAANAGADAIVVSNDDVAIEPGIVGEMASAMELTDATIVAPDGEGDCGWFYMLNLHSGIRPDESYIWWYGDNDLYERAHKAGGVLYIQGDFRHLHPNENTLADPSLQAIAKLDEQRWKERHS